jgi:toxin ParE1/3/4
VNFVFHPRAEAEHLEQVAYYEAQQRGLGSRYLDDVASAITFICEAPHRFPVVRKPSLRRLGLKQFPLPD